MEKNMLTKSGIRALLFLGLAFYPVAGVFGQHDHDHDHGQHDHSQHDDEHGEDMGGMPEMLPWLAEMFEACQKYSQPDEHHQMLAKMSGEWDTTITFYMMGPDKPGMVSKGHSTCRMVNDGRTMLEHATGEGMSPEEAFEGWGMHGYDRMKGKYVSTWADNHGTGIMMSEGEADASGKVITFRAEMDDPRGGGRKMNMRNVLTISDSPMLVFYHTDPEGKEIKVMDIVYNRAGKRASAGSMD